MVCVDSLWHRFPPAMSKEAKLGECVKITKNSIFKLGSFAAHRSLVLESSRLNPHLCSLLLSHYEDLSES